MNLTPNFSLQKLNLRMNCRHGFEGMIKVTSQGITQFKNLTQLKITISSLKLELSPMKDLCTAIKSLDTLNNLDLFLIVRELLSDQYSTILSQLKTLKPLSRLSLGIDSNFRDIINESALVELYSLIQAQTHLRKLHLSFYNNAKPDQNFKNLIPSTSNLLNLEELTIEIYGSKFDSLIFSFFTEAPWLQDRLLILGLRTIYTTTKLEDYCAALSPIHNFKKLKTLNLACIGTKFESENSYLLKDTLSSLKKISGLNINIKESFYDW